MASEELIWMPVKASRVDLFNQLSRCFENYENENPNCFPSLRGCTDIVVASDYSGEHQNAGFSAYSFLVFNGNESEQWFTRSCNVREKFLSHGREMKYEKLNHDIFRQQALTPFLEAANCIDGLLITLLVSTRVKSMLEPGGVEHLQKIAPLLANWKSGTIEKLYRIQTFLAFLLAGLCDPGQKTYWLTDDDEIVANPERLDAASKMLRLLSKSHFTRDILLGSVDTIKSMDARIANPAKDLASIPDLVGGALVDAWSATDKIEFAIKSGKAVRMAQSIPEKAKVIIEWLMHDDKPLRRQVAAIDFMESDPNLLDFNWLKFS